MFQVEHFLCDMFVCLFCFIAVYDIVDNIVTARIM